MNQTSKASFLLQLFVSISSPEECNQEQGSGADGLGNLTLCSGSQNQIEGTAVVSKTTRQLERYRKGGEIDKGLPQ